MNKIVALIGSRRKAGNTVTFVRSILDKLPGEKFEIEYIFPQDFEVSPCIGCGSCFAQIRCVVKDELPILQNKVLDADIFIVASPVYLHYMTADLQLILEKSSWWAHTLRLQGKPIVVLSTCQSNGHRTVIEPLSKIMTYMGGNVIAAANASQYPDQLNNSSWLDLISLKINQRIIEFSKLLPQSNDFLEEVFSNLKKEMLEAIKMTQEMKVEYGEVNYWKETGLLECDNFSEYLLNVGKKEMSGEKNYG